MSWENCLKKFWTKGHSVPLNLIVSPRLSNIDFKKNAILPRPCSISYLKSTKPFTPNLLYTLSFLIFKRLSSQVSRHWICSKLHEELSGLPPKHTAKFYQWQNINSTNSKYILFALLSPELCSTRQSCYCPISLISINEITKCLRFFLTQRLLSQHSASISRFHKSFHTPPTNLKQHLRMRIKHGSVFSLSDSFSLPPTDTNL